MIQVSRLGVTAGIFTLYEIEDGKLRITVKPEKFKPVGEYFETARAVLASDRKRYR